MDGCEEVVIAFVASRACRKVNGVYVELAYRMSSFVADVWAASVLLKAAHGASGASPTRIARWLWNEERQGDYAKSSLRPLVYRAMEVIKELETHGKDEGDAPFWGAIDLCTDPLD